MTRLAVVAAFMGVWVVACGPTRRESTLAEPIAPIPVYELSPTTADTGLTIAPSRSRDPFEALGATKRVTLAASNANARTLLLWLAREAGISIIVSPEVEARVSVSFSDVPAAEAMRAIILDAGLSVLTTGPQSPWPPVVFHQLPVNVNQVSAETIVSRFGVSVEMARWIVETRPRP